MPSRYEAPVSFHLFCEAITSKKNQITLHQSEQRVARHATSSSQFVEIEELTFNGKETQLILFLKKERRIRANNSK